MFKHLSLEKCLPQLFQSASQSKFTSNGMAAQLPPILVLTYTYFVQHEPSLLGTISFPSALSLYRATITGNALSYTGNSKRVNVCFQ